MLNIMYTIFVISLAIISAIFVKQLQIELHAPSSSYVRKKKYNEGNKCYILKPIVHVCPINISMKN